MRIWFKTNPKDHKDRSLFEGDMECRVRLDGQEKDIVFRARCEDQGMQDIMAELLNMELTQAIQDGTVVCGLFSKDCVDREEGQSVGEEEEESHENEEDSDTPQEEGQEEARVREGEGAISG